MKNVLYNISTVTTILTANCCRRLDASWDAVMAAVEAWANSSLIRAASLSLASCVTRLASRSAVYKNTNIYYAM